MTKGATFLHVRPFFWLLLAIACAITITLAVLVKTDPPASMQVHLEQQQPLVNETTGLKVYLTDTQGLPIQQAQAMVSTNMTNMDMGENLQPLMPKGDGSYETLFRPSMSGPWSLTITVHAHGFEPLHQTIFVQVV
ncbi:hypothetical protein EPA93_24285 [Ktedonosporobacter rubrisoli]|uniref:YtkA-like domain-containing protein n=1 Tax=Ktedonosporobacter rubrisoli TaxID=2509675 RepID=A0A4P6JUG7_KTERU|nr:FixH family protein [Ktedonosporobacter rubrisoli]QBD78932.1 hypothetical protein EPA93_24285 [Ktedonosporobacter rubrisoli]